MANPKLFVPRNLAMFTIAGLGGAYMIVKARTLAIKQQEKEVRDYSVSVDRSGGGI